MHVNYQPFKIGKNCRQEGKHIVYIFFLLGDEKEWASMANNNNSKA